MTVGIVQAEGQIVPLRILNTTYDVGRGHIRHAPSRGSIPVVEIDGNIIFIHSLQPSSNITVTLEDIDGYTIYNISTTITEVNLSFLVTQDILDRAHTITLNIDGKEYLGEI